MRMCPIQVSALAQCHELCVCWQVKAHLRGDSPPLSAQQLDVVLDMANTASRELLGALPLLPCSSCLTVYHMCPRNCMIGQRAAGSSCLTCLSSIAMPQARSAPQHPTGWRTTLRQWRLARAGPASWCAGCGRRQVRNCTIYCCRSGWHSSLTAVVDIADCWQVVP
jgi:hypothetical protein